MLAAKDEPLWWLIEQLLGQGAEAAGQHYFGTTGAVLTAVAVGMTFDAYLGKGQDKPSDAKPVRALVLVMSFLAIVIVGLVGGALLWAAMARTFPAIEGFGQAGGLVSSMAAATIFYLLVMRKEIW